MGEICVLCVHFCGVLINNLERYLNLTETNFKQKLYYSKYRHMGLTHSTYRQYIKILSVPKDFTCFSLKFTRLSKSLDTAKKFH